MAEFFAMGGYAVYVWTAYGFAALVLLVLLAHSWRSGRRREAELEQVRKVARPGRPSRPKPARVADRPASAELARPATE
jgi:heme exporter protein D